MFGRFAKVQLAGGVTILCLMLGIGCAFADKRATAAPAAQTNRPMAVRAAQNVTPRAVIVPAIAATKLDGDAATGSSCEDQQSQLEAILARGPEGSGRDDLTSFSRTVTCERLGPLVVAAIDRFNADSAGITGPAANSPELVRATQVELNRLGCFDGKINGSLVTTRDALARYMSSGGGTVTSPDITEALVADLAGHTDRVCPLSCASGEIARGDACIIDASRTDPAVPLPLDVGPKSVRERHAGPADAPPDQAARPKAAAAPPHVQPAGPTGGARKTSVYGIGF